MHAGYAFIFGGEAMMNAQPKPKLPPAAGFETNAFYEKILDLRRTNPKAFDSLAPMTKVSLGHYEAAQREDERLRSIRDEPDAE
jgi:hypothetical protein